MTLRLGYDMLLSRIGFPFFTSRDEMEVMKDLGDVLNKEIEDKIVPMLEDKE